MTNHNTAKAKLKATNWYSEDFVDDMTTAEATTLWQLHQQRDEAFDAIGDAICDELGLDRSQLPDRQKADIEAKADRLTANFDEAQHEANALPLLYVKRWCECEERIKEMESRIESYCDLEDERQYALAKIEEAKAHINEQEKKIASLSEQLSDRK
jgi:hypothetical protein